MPRIPFSDHVHPCSYQCSYHFHTIFIHIETPTGSCVFQLVCQALKMALCRARAKHSAAGVGGPFGGIWAALVSWFWASISSSRSDTSWGLGENRYVFYCFFVCLANYWIPPWIIWHIEFFFNFKSNRDRCQVGLSLHGTSGRIRVGVWYP